MDPNHDATFCICHESLQSKYIKNSSLDKFVDNIFFVVICCVAAWSSPSQLKHKVAYWYVFHHAWRVGRGGCRIRIEHHGLMGEGDRSFTCREKKEKEDKIIV